MHVTVIRGMYAHWTIDSERKKTQKVQLGNYYLFLILIFIYSCSRMIFVIFLSLAQSMAEFIQRCESTAFKEKIHVRTRMSPLSYRGDDFAP